MAFWRGGLLWSRPDVILINSVLIVGFVVVLLFAFLRSRPFGDGGQSESRLPVRDGGVEREGRDKGQGDRTGRNYAAERGAVQCSARARAQEAGHVCVQFSEGEWKFCFCNCAKIVKNLDVESSCSRLVGLICKMIDWQSDDNIYCVWRKCCSFIQTAFRS